jgi:hypothetical protein
MEGRSVTYCTYRYDIPVDQLPVVTIIVKLYLFVAVHDDFPCKKLRLKKKTPKYAVEEHLRTKHKKTKRGTE